MRRVDFRRTLLCIGSALAVAAFAGVYTSANADPLSSVRFDQVQSIGTHNSYHIEPAETVSRPDLAYTHPPLTRQLQMGLRFFELDVHVPLMGSSPSNVEVFHVAGIDEGSRCRLLAMCLSELEAFRKQNQLKEPILVQFELKTLPQASSEDVRRAWLSIEEVIASAIDSTQVFQPSDMASNPRRLRSHVRRHGWPTLGALGGRFIFIVNSGDRETRIYSELLAARQAHLMFPASNNPNESMAAIVSIVEPNDKRICEVSSRGQLVITYADWRTFAARLNDPTGRHRAFASGAQLIATDFPTSDTTKSAYRVSFPNQSNRDGTLYIRRRPNCLQSSN